MAQNHFREFAVQHDAPKVWSVYGKPRDGSPPVRLAVVGEGDADERSEQTLRMTADACAQAINELYTFDAMMRDREERGVDS